MNYSGASQETFGFKAVRFVSEHRLVIMLRERFDDHSVQHFQVVGDEIDKSRTETQREE